MRSAMALTHHMPHHEPVEYEGLLYPLLVIAAVAVIVFSLLGIASVSGWMPSALRSDALAISSTEQAPPTAAFRCAECGVMESVQRVADKSAH